MGPGPTSPSMRWDASTMVGKGKEFVAAILFEDRVRGGPSRQKNTTSLS